MLTSYEPLTETIFPSLTTMHLNDNAIGDFDFLDVIETLLMLILEFLFVIHHPSLSLQAFLLGHDSLTEHVLMTGGEG